VKILQIMAGAAHGGAETAFVDMCIALHEAGENIEVITRPNKIRVARLHAAGIKVHTAPFGGKIDIYTRWRIEKIIKKFKPDIVQTWMARATEKTPRWRASMNIARYVTVARLGGYYDVKYFLSAEYFITNTPDIKTHLIRNGADQSKIRTINNFAETEIAAVPASRVAHDTPEKAVLLLAMGRLHVNKAFDVLIRSMADVPDVYLWIAGEGSERKNLESLIENLGLSGRVKLLGWREDRAAILKACDIFVLSSRAEPLGTVFIQAWAQGKPVIASASEGPLQFMNDGKDGLIFPVDDSAVLTETIKNLINNKNLSEALAKAGYERYRADFTKESVIAAYLGFYHEVIKEMIS
jgi:glycosyltransferase involved in cell wall biosynthesis